MKNLFIMHTQYNLILSSAVLSRYKDAENTLVLFSEFALTDEMKAALQKVFDKVVVVRENFNAPKSALEEIKEIRICLKKAKEIRNERFDNVFMSQERVFDMILCARAKKLNPHARCYNIEEDAYYSIDNKYNAEDFTYTESKRMKRRKFLYALLLLGYPYNYKDVQYCYGMSEEYHGANLLFPYLARKELQSKELLEIKKDELIAGIDAIYSQKKTTYPESDKYTLFFFDLMNRYKNPEKVKEIVKEVIETAKKERRTVLFKYHPRETEKFTDIEGAFEIPHLIPAEKVLYDLKDKDTVVMGNATTACVVAAKLGFKVISICKLEFPDNTKMHNKMGEMGVFCIENICDIETIFDKEKEK